MTKTEELIAAQAKMLELLKNYLDSGEYCVNFEMELGLNAEPECMLTLLRVNESGTESNGTLYYDLSNVEQRAKEVIATIERLYP